MTRITKILAVLVIGLCVAGCGPQVEVTPADSQLHSGDVIEIEVLPEPPPTPQLGDLSEPFAAETLDASELDPPHVFGAGPADLVDGANAPQLVDLKPIATDGKTDTYFIGGREYKLPAGRTVRLNIKTGAWGSSASAGLKASGGDATRTAIEWNTRPPTVKLDDVGQASGGSASLDGKWIVEHRVMIFYVAAVVVLVVAGVLAWLLKSIKIAIVGFALALALVVMGYLVNNAGWLLVGLAVVAVVGIAAWFWLTRKQGQTQMTVEKLTGAIEKIAPVVKTAVAAKAGETLTLTVDVADVVRKAITAEAGESNVGTVRKIVRAAKNKLGLTATA